MLPFLLFIGCTPDVGLYFVATHDSTIDLTEASVSMSRYQLGRCDDRKDSEWVGRRIDMFAPVPDTINDREYCEMRLRFSLGSALRLDGFTVNNTAFTIRVNPDVVDITQTYGGGREDLAVVLDTQTLIDAAALDLQAAEEAQTQLTFNNNSALSTAIAEKLPEAITVETLAEARQRIGLTAVTFELPPDEGCGSGGETGTVEYVIVGDTGDTGFVSEPVYTTTTSSGCSSSTTTSSGDINDTSPPLAVPVDDEEPEEDGGGCFSGSADTGPSSSDDTDDTDDTEIDPGFDDDNDDDDDESSSSADTGSASGGGCAGGTIDTAGVFPRRVTALAGLLLFWGIRRRSLLTR
ncbi:MAG: hypothetical protein AAFV53_23500 [Myxococcota bacterium]